MVTFGNPRNFKESYGLVIILLRLAGLFPFGFDEINNKLYVSWKGLSCTVLHIIIYTYVNVTSIMESWVDFSQPMLGHSSLTAFGNLVLRLLGIFITFLIMTPYLLGSVKYVSSFNMYMHLMEESILLGIDVSCIYRRVYFVSCFATVALSGLLAFTAWHSIYFYEHITQKPPELKFYLVATLSAFYKILFIFYGNMQLFGLYMISTQLNKFLAELRDRYRQIYENERKAKNAWMPKDVKVF